MKQARALMILGTLLAIAAGVVLSMAASDYTSTRRTWRRDAHALGTGSYDADASDAHYEQAEAALAKAKTTSHVLGFALLLGLTGLFGWHSRSAGREAALPKVSAGRALTVVWLDIGLCATLLVLNMALMPHGARLLSSIAGALVPWLMAALLTAPVASGFTLAGVMLGMRLRNDAGERPSPLRALGALPLLPLTLLSAILSLPVHLALLALGRHPGSHRVTVHASLLGLHGIRWRRAQPAA